MKLKSLFLIFILLCFPISAYGSSLITITVLDEETKKPIEGAVAIAFWNQAKGIPGMTRTETVKIVEAVSDKDGRFTIPAVSVSIFADKPHLKVYKPGYVGWYNKEIYKGHYGDNVSSVKTIKRVDFKWHNQVIFLKLFNNNYSRISHDHFLNRLMPTSYKSGGEGLYIQETLYEVPFIQKERTEKDKSLKTTNKPLS